MKEIPADSIKIFLCYAHEDEELLNNLNAHLQPLRRSGKIETWHDRHISAGMKWEQEIGVYLNAAHIILLLVSPDFIKSEYCYGIEMTRALERHHREEAMVIPIILRHVLWKETPFRDLKALPKDGKPVLGRFWHNQDEALVDVAEGINSAVDNLINQKKGKILREEQDRKIKEEQDRKIREEQDRKLREEQDRKLKEEQDRKSGEEQDKSERTTNPAASGKTANRKATLAHLPNWSIITLWAITTVLLIIYFVVPLDLTALVNPWYRLANRTLELLYVFVWGSGLLRSGSHFFQHRDDLYGTFMKGIFSFVLGTILLAVQFFFFRSTFTFWGQVELIGLIIIMAITGFLTVINNHLSNWSIIISWAIIIAILIIYFTVPLALFTQVNFWYPLADSILVLLYVLMWGSGLLRSGLHFFQHRDDLYGTLMKALFPFLLGSILLAAQFFLFHQPALIGLFIMIVIIVLLAVFLITFRA